MAKPIGGSLTEQTVNKLTGMIISEKKFEAGEKLPNEATLADTLGVSRVTLREAIRMLSAQGLVETRRGIGTFVTENKQIINGGLGNLEAISEKVSQELFEMRLICEPEAVYYATLRASDGELEEIRARMMDIEDCVRNNLPRTVPEQAFHNALAVAAHNSYMSRLIPILNRSIEEVVTELDESTDIISTSLSDHRLIVEMMEARNAHGAKAAMRLHMCHAFQYAGFTIE
ncbi:MAG: FadR/GntR family transcriptional regulator [Oscillospiraceae bacterium]